MRLHVSRLLSVFCIVATLVPLTAVAQEVPAPEAWSALERGDASKAAAIFREALDRSPSNPALLFGAGYAAYMLGRHGDAISSLKKAVAVDPRMKDAFVLLAKIAYETTDLDLSIKSLEKAVALDPRDRALKEELEHRKKESSVHGAMSERPGARFRVLFEGAADKAVSDRVARTLESAYWRIGKALNSYPSETLTVMLYTDQNFQDITRAPAWSGGGYDGLIRLPARGALRSPAALDRVVTHEFVHAVITSSAPRGVPAWVHEGLASYFELGSHAWTSEVLRLADGQLTLEQMTDGFARFDSDTALVAYAQSYVAAKLLVETLGVNLGTFIQLLGGGQTYDQALSALNVKPDGFQAEWKRRLRAIRGGAR